MSFIEIHKANNEKGGYIIATNDSVYIASDIGDLTREINKICYKDKQDNKVKNKSIDSIK